MLWKPVDDRGGSGWEHGRFGARTSQPMEGVTRSYAPLGAIHLRDQGRRTTFMNAELTLLDYSMILEI